MHEIFISYSTTRRDLTERLAAVIEHQYGKDAVWWDTRLEADEAFHTQIATALAAARVVIVIWTRGAAVSDYVYSEARRATRHGKLVNVRGDDIPFDKIPQPFDIYQVEDFANTDRILATVARVMRGNRLPTRVSEAEYYFRDHGKRVLDPKQMPLPTDPNALAKLLPSDLLQAKYAVVDYDDAAGACAAMLTWCLNPAEPLAGRLVHGPGGLGKTRLMIETAARLRDERGWQAGFLDRPPDDAAVARQRMRALEQMVQHPSGAGVLIVVDYAEARQAEVKALAARFMELGVGSAQPVRLVLLTRGAGEWWRMALEEDEALRTIFAAPRGEDVATHMPSMPTGQHRLDYFLACVKKLVAPMHWQGYPRPSGQPSVARLVKIESGERYKRPLAIQMEAVLWLASSAPGDDEQGVDKLLDNFVGLEREHWAKLVGKPTLDTETRRALARGVAQVTVIQGVENRPSSYRLLRSDRFYEGARVSDGAVAPLHDNLTTLYGKPNEGLAPLEPDLIGEHLIAGQADAVLVDACLAWIETEPEDGRTKRREDILTVLQRATQPEHGETSVARASALLDHCIAHHGATLAPEIVKVMGDTPGKLFDRLEALVDVLPVEALAAINFVLPVQHTGWMELSLRVADRNADLARNLLSAAHAADHDRERDAILNNAAAALGTLGIRYANLQRLDDALAASEEAVKILRDLYDRKPDVYGPDLATSLNNISVDYANLQRLDDALAASEEAVKIRRDLYDRKPDVYGPDLATSLSVLSHVSAMQSRTLDAANQAHEALAILAPFVERYPASFGGLARVIGGDIIKYSAAAGREPDMALLQRVARALGMQQEP
ncbi:MAG: toll/interleukin-1 receptor domain-containing protein [Hyphomicrobium sp.]|nr:toll/interleukin-1 receptor domain-containing protein [Hyphomicrobium sp.]